MSGDASPAIAEEEVAQSLVIVVPRAKLDLCESLSNSFGDDAKVQVILDRRFIDRRVQADRHEPEQRRRDRRLRSDMDAELRAGRWIVVPRASEQIDFLDPDTQAILFRSEEHTSELQSRLHLVCRLLLEKKKNEKRGTTPDS